LASTLIERRYRQLIDLDATGSSLASTLIERRYRQIIGLDAQ
jgi:hypothetical protein